MNQTIMTGNLTVDIETKDIHSKSQRDSGQHLSKFTLACNEGDRVVFIPVEAWNMPHLAEHLHKGSKTLISGALKQDNWETDAGEKRSRIVLTAYKVEFLDPAPEQSSPTKQSSGANRTKGKSYRHRAA